jgi:hypothetical protein
MVATPRSSPTLVPALSRNGSIINSNHEILTPCKARYINGTAESDSQIVKEIVAPDMVIQIRNEYSDNKDGKNLLVIYTDPLEKWKI